jgi:ATP-dependent DNA helicase RecQ
MLDGAVATLGRWSKVWGTRPTAVVPLPAIDMRSNRQLAEHIAKVGKLPMHDVFTWTGGATPDDAASTPVVAHLETVLTITEDHELPRGPVLFVTTDVRTRWTATVAGAMLRAQGIPAVLLLALHLRP